jgi:hypothetical protein
VVGKVDFTSACYCKDCQTIGGPGFGSTSLMIYDLKGIRFTGAEEQKVSHAKLEVENKAQR